MRRLTLAFWLWLTLGAAALMTALIGLVVLSDPLWRYGLAIFLGVAGVANIVHAVQLRRRGNGDSSPPTEADGA